MNKFSKTLTAILLVFVLNMPSVFAQNTSDSTPQIGTVLPETTVSSVKECQILMNDVERNMINVRDKIFRSRGTMTLGNKTDATANDVMGCGIKTGNIALWMVPFYIRYVLEFIIGIAGVLAVGGMIFGGYLYMFSGFSENKDKGKNAIIYGIAGFVLALASFAIVNIVIAFLTG